MENLDKVKDININKDKDDENIINSNEEKKENDKVIKVNENENKEDLDDDDDDFDIDKLAEEANLGIEVEYLGDKDPYDDLWEEEELNDIKQNENQNQNDTNNIEEESFKNDDDVKKMMERKKLITLSEFPDFEADGEIYSIDIFQKKGIVAFGDGEESTYVYDIVNKKLLNKEKYSKDSVISVKFSFDKSIFMSASMDGTIRLFDSETLELVSVIEDSSDEIMVRIIILDKI